ncbi:MAG TPA: M24B family metallopeptidase, partial [Gammaproteobacteria bacterium]|nr:M24B family metallopeptidase [Gammaproteobacteria bacterium]
CVLHYTANKEILQDSELVLVDAGCEYQNYCADVSRTFPVNGRFNPEQREIYQLVLTAYREGLKQIRPGSTWPKVQGAAIEALTQGLIKLKLLQGKASDLILAGAFKKFFMHGVGHWLGLDVHDVGPYKTNDDPTVFQEGMVLTLEPGIYISALDDIDKKWWHIGVRIEDDILVTAQGHEVLSSAAPITLEDIEQLMQ